MLTCCREYFSSLLNKPSTCKDSLDAISQLPIEIHLDLPQNLHEISSPINSLKSGKALGPTAFHQKSSKLLSDHYIGNCTLFSAIWCQASLPSDRKDALIAPIYKHIGDCSNFENYRGVSLLSFVADILSMVLTRRLSVHLAGQVLSEAQCGF